jgi:transcriptional regulator with XRE-family HTH domain
VVQDEQSIGERIRWARLRAALTQEELSAKSSIPKATISRIENGLNQRPRVSTVRRLGLALGIDPGWLLVGDDDVKLVA